MENGESRSHESCSSFIRVIEQLIIDCCNCYFQSERYTMHFMYSVNSSSSCSRKAHVLQAYVIGGALS